MSGSAIFVIARKDLFRILPLWAWYWGMLALAAMLAPIDDGSGHSLNLAVLWPCSVLIGGLIVVTVVHEDGLAGSDLYWRTLPLSTPSLILSKILVVLLSVNLPLTLIQLILLITFGALEPDSIGQVLWSHLSLTGLILLPLCALAAVTRTIKEALLGIIGIAGFLALILYGLYIRRSLYPSLPSGDPGGAPWFISTVSAVVIATFAVVTVLVQASTRRLFLSRSILAIGVTIGMFGARSIPGRTAVAVQALFSPRCEVCPSVRLILDPGHRELSQVPLRRSPANGSHIAVPIAFDGVPAEYDIVPEATEVRGKLSGKPVRMTSRELPAGNYWLVVDQGAFEDGEVGDGAVLEGDLPAIGFRRSVWAKASSLPNKDSGSGACKSVSELRTVFLSCVVVGHNYSLALEFPDHARHWVVPPYTVEFPSPPALSLQPLREVRSFLSYERVLFDSATVIRASPVFRTAFPFRIALPRGTKAQ